MTDGEHKTINTIHLHEAMDINRWYFIIMSVITHFI